VVYPELRVVDERLAIGEDTYKRDVCIQVNGRVRKPKRPKDEATNQITPRQLKRLCVGGPEIVFLGTGPDGTGEVTDEARRFLEQRGIKYEILKTAKAAAAFNACDRRKAALLQAGV